MKDNVEAFVAIAIAVVVAIIICIGLNDRSIVVIDGCEYIQQNGLYSRSLAHKGNCTNAIHLDKQAK